jgi:hypothetical protein
MAAKTGDLEPAKTLWPAVRPLITKVVEQLTTFLSNAHHH